MVKRRNLLLIILFALLLLQFISAGASPDTNIGELGFQAINSIKIENIEAHVKYFSSLGSRVDGYPGYYSARDYIITFLKNLGYNVTVHEFKTVSPIEEECYIELEDGRRIEAHALWPNGLIQPSNTPAGGYKGRLIYVGKGEMKDFDGKDVAGAIVLMDYDSGRNWLNAAKLGAKAVIFVGTGRYDRYEALEKFSMVPVRFTRVYVDENTGSLLKELAAKNARVKVYSKVSLKEITGYNIIATLEGTSLKDQIIAISARYDSWSVVPAKSPAAGEAIGVSTLLELAQFFAEHRPKRTIMIVAFSGHWNGLAGARAFARDVLLKKPFTSGELKIYSFVGIDIGDENPKLSVLYAGYGIRFIASDRISGYLAPVELRFTRNSYLYSKTSTGKTLFEVLADTASRITGRRFTSVEDFVRWDIVSQDWWGDQNYPYMLDTEPLALANVLAYSFKTAGQRNLWWGNPFNDFYTINFDNVYVQALTIAVHLAGLTNDETLSVKWEEKKPSRFTTLYGYMVGYTILTGETMKINITSGWYSPVPHALVRIYPQGPYEGAGWPFSYLLLYSDDRGFFNVSIGPIYSTPTWLFDAWIIDEDSGEIVAATDQGPLYGKSVTKQGVSPITGSDHVIIPMFDCIPVTVFDVYDPAFFRTPAMLDPRQPFTLWLDTVGVPKIFNFNTKAEPYFYGYVYLRWEPLAVFFVQPGVKATFNFYFGSLDYPGLVLVNTSEENTEGFGFLINRPIIFNLTMYQYTKDMLNLVRGRYSRLSSLYVRNPSIEKGLKRAEILFRNATIHLKNKEYDEAYSELRQALACISMVYKRDLMPIYSDAGLTATLLLLISIPAVVIMERLFVHKEGRDRFIATIMIGVAVFAVLYILHPAFQVMTNTILSMMGSLLTFLILLTFIVLLGETGKVIEETSIRILGKHRIKGTEQSALQISVPLSIELMRSRKVRSGLTIFIILSIVIALTSLTSASYYSEVMYFSYGHYSAKAEKPSILIKLGYGVPPFSILHPETVNLVESIIGNYGVVAPRAWYYPIYSNRLGHTYDIEGKNSSYKAVAILGLTAEEVVKLEIESGSYLASALNFNETKLKQLWKIKTLSSSNIVILTSEQAKSLNMSLGDTVRILGMNLEVYDILPSESLGGIVDIDNFYPTPSDPSGNQILAIQIAGQPVFNPPPLDWNYIAIMPYDLVVKMGGYVGSIRIYLNCDEKTAEKLAYEIAFQSSLVAYVLKNPKTGSVMQSYITKAFLLLGMQSIPVILILGALNVMVALLGSVKERTREIYILTSLGLSPTGAATLFIVEALTYALLASVAGYIVGFLLNKAFIVWGVLPSTFSINAASIFVGLSLAAVILSAVLASIYPAIISARLITPSLERKWTPPTKPKGDIWEIPLPVMFPSAREAKGFLNFLKEYYLGEGKMKAKFIVRDVKLDLEKLILELNVSLAPFELNISQQAVIATRFEEFSNKWTIVLTLKRISGVYSTWVTSSYNFIDDLRKQILIWRSLSPKEHEKYFVD